jgi:predicted oxidoreductase
MTATIANTSGKREIKVVIPDGVASGLKVQQIVRTGWKSGRLGGKRRTVIVDVPPHVRDRIKVTHK